MPTTVGMNVNQRRWRKGRGAETLIVVVQDVGAIGRRTRLHGQISALRKEYTKLEQEQSTIQRELAMELQLAKTETSFLKDNVS